MIPLRQKYTSFNGRNYQNKGGKENGKKKGTYTKVMAAHEVRMWIGQVIIPGAVATWIIAQTDLGHKIGDGLRSAGHKIKRFFTKKK